MSVRLWVGSLAMACMLSGCSFLNSLLTPETPRFQAASLEGRYSYTEKSVLAKDKLFDAVAGWVADAYNSQQSAVMQNDKAQGLIILNGRGAVNYFGGEQQCRYVLTLRVADNQVRLDFETRDLENGYAPNPSHYSQMESQYQTIRSSLLNQLAALENAAKK
jgi:hypothetical protein